MLHKILNNILTYGSVIAAIEIAVIGGCILFKMYASILLHLAQWGI